MGLDVTQAIEAVKSPPNASEVKNGENYESKLRILTLPLELSDLNKETGWHTLLGGQKSKLTPSKYTAICKFFTYPLSIVMMSNDICTDLYKVFDGRNANYSVDYPNDRIKETGTTLLAELDLLNWIKKVGKKVLKCAPNTIVVIDKNELGDPVLLAVTNEKLVGYEFNNDGSFSCIVFIHSTGTTEGGDKWTKYGVYDDEWYRVILELNSGYSIDTENAHDLGACPARFFYDNPLVNKHKFSRCIPIANAKGVMNQWLIIDTYDYHQDNYASFQVIQYALSDCSNDSCTDGVIYIDPVQDENNVVITAGYNTACSTCAKNALVGSGSAIGIDVSSDPSEADARDVFKFIAPDIPALEYTGKKQDGRERKIKENTVGYSDAITSAAINETQVKALVESRKKPLFDIKVHLENLYKWAAESSIKLTHNIDVVANANYGTEFFILSAQEIQELIIQAKVAGAPATYIEQLNKMLIVTEYKNDPNLIQRMLICADVQPQPFATQLEARDLFVEKMMTREDYYWHSNFTDLLTDFELDNGSIVMFGEELTYSAKIAAIRRNFIHLIQQKLPQEDEQEPTDDEAQPLAISDNGA